MSNEEQSQNNGKVAAKNPGELEVSDKDNEVEEVEDNEDQGKDPFPVKLPREIMDIIFSYLDPASIKTVRLVSRLSW